MAGTDELGMVFPAHADRTRRATLPRHLRVDLSVDLSDVADSGPFEGVMRVTGQLGGLPGSAPVVEG